MIGEAHPRLGAERFVAGTGGIIHVAVAALPARARAPGPKPVIPFTTADLFDPNVKRPFNSIAEMAAEHGNVRIWGGIHFRNSREVGDDMGKKIAAYLIANSLKSVR